MSVWSSSELAELESEILRLAKKYPKKAKRFLGKQGNKLKAKAKKVARGKLKKKTGNYLNGFKRGKIYNYKDDEATVRVYNSMPHAHLIEYGHVKKDRTGKEHGFKKGYHILEEAERDFRDDFIKATDEFIDEVIEEGGF